MYCRLNVSLRFSKLRPRFFSSSFRLLSEDEKKAVELYDFRVDSPNKKLLLTCEHATNKYSLYLLLSIHNYYFPSHDQPFLQTHWGYDIGAKDMALEIGEKNQVFTICSNFSRLLIDPCRSLISETLIRKYVEKDIALQINSDGGI